MKTVEEKPQREITRLDIKIQKMINRTYEMNESQNPFIPDGLITTSQKPLNGLQYLLLGILTQSEQLTLRFWTLARKRL